MEINKEIILKNYNEIENDIKKYSPYPEKVKILFVTKYLNIEEHKEIISAGFGYFGENKAQVFRDKLQEFENNGLKWDFIGRLQKNKIKYIIKHVNLIHSVDSTSLLEEINKKAIENERVVDILIQVNVSNEETKTGFDLAELEDLFKIIVKKNIIVKTEGINMGKIFLTLYLSPTNTLFLKNKKNVSTNISTT